MKYAFNFHQTTQVSENDFKVYLRTIIVDENTTVAEIVKEQNRILNGGKYFTNMEMSEANEIIS